MIFGEFAWQPASLIEKQLNVNLVGAMNVTGALISRIIRNEGGMYRTIIVVKVKSHFTDRQH